MLTSVTRAVVDRSGCRCEAQCPGCTEAAGQMHHRKSRLHGGHETADNLMVVCQACHRFIHENPEYSRSRGLIVPSWAELRETPIRSATHSSSAAPRE